MDHIKLLGTINPLESLNQMMATIQPKFIMRKNVNSYDLYAMIVALKTNHGSSILRQILIAMGFPNDSIPPNLINHWNRMDAAKTKKRSYIQRTKVQSRRKNLKSIRKSNDKEAKLNRNNSLGSYKDY